jgi:hypothetical protein
LKKFGFASVLPLRVEEDAKRSLEVEEGGGTSDGEEVVVAGEGMEGFEGAEAVCDG